MKNANENEYLSEKEIKNICRKYKFNSLILNDEIMKLRNDNIQKLQPFIRSNNKKKKKYINNINSINIKPDPYKFKQIPTDIKTIIIKLMQNNYIGLTTLAYKCNIHAYIIEKYLYYNMPIDNNDLFKILSFFNYDLNTGNFINNSYQINNKTINLENIALKNMDIEPIDLKTIDIDKI